MQFIDTHCHLNFDTYAQRINDVVDRAQQNGVTKIVVPGVDLASSEKAVKLAEKYEIIFAGIGVHPSDFGSYQQNQYKAFLDLSKEKKVVAIGEIGLDLFHHPETEKAQLLVLDQMLDLAQSSEKPVILHSRNCMQNLLTKIIKWKEVNDQKGLKIKGVFHAFEGTIAQAKVVKSIGFFLGFGGPLTYRNALEKQELLKTIGMENIVLETDSPFLSPHPFRGQENEPARIPIIAQKVADLLELPIADIALKTSANAQLLFRMD